MGALRLNIKSFKLQLLFFQILATVFGFESVSLKYFSYFPSYPTKFR